MMIKKYYFIFKIIILPILFTTMALKAMEDADIEIRCQPPPPHNHDGGQNIRPNTLLSLSIQACSLRYTKPKDIPAFCKQPGGETSPIPPHLVYNIKLAQKPNKTMMWEQLEYAITQDNKSTIRDYVRFIVQTKFPWQRFFSVNSDIISTEIAEYLATLPLSLPTNVHQYFREELHKRQEEFRKASKASTICVGITLLYTAITPLALLSLFLFK
jgi:hypothetical protein